MRILCRHGHLAFYPRDAEDISRFSNLFDVELVKERDFYTFQRLQGAADYSLALKPYLTLPATRTFEGDPWDLMRENNWVYHIATDLIVIKTAVTEVIQLPAIGFCFLAESPIIQPGSITEGGRILSYSGEWNQGKAQLKITEFDYE